MILPLVLFLSLLYNVNAQCQRSDHKYIGDLCYVVSNTQLNFQDARSYCNGQNQNLAVEHTTLQANFLASIIRTQTGAPEGKFWIGLSRPSLSSRFAWDDGTTMFWSNFDLNFPKDSLYVAESTVNGKWLTLDGKQSLYFVCSYDPARPVTGSPQQSTTYQDASTAAYGTTDYPWTSTASPSASTGGSSTRDYSTSTTGYATDTPSTSAAASSIEYDTTLTPSTFFSTGSSASSDTPGSTIDYSTVSSGSTGDYSPTATPDTSTTSYF